MAWRGSFLRTAAAASPCQGRDGKDRRRTAFSVGQYHFPFFALRAGFGPGRFGGVAFRWVAFLSLSSATSSQSANASHVTPSARAIFTAAVKDGLRRPRPYS